LLNLKSLGGFFLLLFATSTALAHVQLDYPVGSETFIRDTTISIEWTVLIAHGPGYWSLEYSADGGTNWVTLSANLPLSTLSYSWTVTQPTTEHGRIKVTQNNNTYADFESASLSFTIQEAATGIGAESAYIDGYYLKPNYPNPFNPSTSLEYNLARSGSVNITIYDLKGNAISELVNEIQSSGQHHLQWDGRNDAGELVESGLYLARLQVGQHSEVIKMSFLK